MAKDLHSHILPKLDDGAESWEESLAIAREAVSDGVTNLVATPHYGRISSPDVIKKSRDLIKQLQKRLNEENIPLEVELGFEVFLSFETLEKIKTEGEKLTIGRTKFVFIEFSFLFLYPNATQMIETIVESGFIPIIAHPERNETLASRPELLYDLIKAGALSQVNTGSLLGDFGARAKKAGFLFLEHSLAHVVATDAHNTSSRPPVFSPAIKALKKHFSDEEIEVFIERNPSLILQGETPKFFPQPIKRRKFLL